MSEREKLLSMIDYFNNRLTQLKKQGESSKNKTLKNLRYKRNLIIKELVNLLQIETSYFSVTKGEGK